MGLQLSSKHVALDKRLLWVENLRFFQHAAKDCQLANNTAQICRSSLADVLRTPLLQLATYDTCPVGRVSTSHNHLPTRICTLLHRHLHSAAQLTHLHCNYALPRCHTGAFVGCCEKAQHICRSRNGTRSFSSHLSQLLRVLFNVLGSSHRIDFVPQQVDEPYRLICDGQVMQWAEIFEVIMISLYPCILARICRSSMPSTFILIGSPGLATHRMQQQSRVALSLPEDVKRSPTCTACGPGIHPTQGMPDAIAGSAC